MGHRDSSAEEPGGHFSMAEHADEWAEAMEDRMTIQRMKSLPKCTDGSQLRAQAKSRYDDNLLQPNGTVCKCATCKEPFVKKRKNQAFCQRLAKKKGSACKDVYHNTQNPERRARSHSYSDQEL